MEFLERVGWLLDHLGIEHSWTACIILFRTVLLEIRRPPVANSVFTRPQEGSFAIGRLIYLAFRTTTNDHGCMYRYLYHRLDLK